VLPVAEAEFDPDEMATPAAPITTTAARLATPLRMFFLVMRAKIEPHLERRAGGS
jgi:hypothetical protein